MLITTNNLDSVQVVAAQDNQFQTFNDKVGELDSFLTEALSVSVSAGNATVAAADYRRYRKLRITGNTTAGRSVTLQAIKREILIDNSDAANTQSIAIVLGSTTINLAAGKKAFVETDGTANGLELVISNDAAGGGIYVAKTGDTMTGSLTISGAASALTVGQDVVIGAQNTRGVLYFVDGSKNLQWDAAFPGFQVNGGKLQITDTTASTSPTTGALRVAGGLGVAGDINCGGTISGITLIPQNSQSGAYTTVLADGGKHLLHPSADTTARTFTIASNASVAYPVGTAITFVNQNAAGVLTIAIATDTMRLAGAGTTGSRTLAANGVATALKIATAEWVISGTGLT
jgi:hypothetical protein